MEKTPAKKTKDLLSQAAVKFKSLVESGALKVPKDYSPDTALKIAGLMFADIADISKATPESVGNALLKTVTLGLNPMRHCHYIMYGNKLSCDENYQGKQMRAYRDADVKSIVAHAINEGDKFNIGIEARTGVVTVKEHEKTLVSMSAKVVGAYAIVTMNDNSYQTTVMNIDQITASWNQRRGSGLSQAHKNFPDQMAIKTVTNRALKSVLKSLDDSSLFYNEKEPTDKPLEDIKQEVKESNDNVQEVEFEEVTEQQPEVVKIKTEKINAEAKAATEIENEEDPF